MKPASELTRNAARRQLDRALRTRADQQRHGFGLRQIEAAVQERAPCEFAGLGQPCAVRDKSLEESAQECGGAMTRELDDILAGVRAGRSHDDTERFVQPLASHRIDDDSKTLRV
jgi:hypothetical protein